MSAVPLGFAEWLSLLQDLPACEYSLCPGSRGWTMTLGSSPSLSRVAACSRPSQFPVWGPQLHIGFALYPVWRVMVSDQYLPMKSIDNRMSNPIHSLRLGSSSISSFNHLLTTWHQRKKSRALDTGQRGFTPQFSY